MDKGRMIARAIALAAMAAAGAAVTTPAAAASAATEGAANAPAKPAKAAKAHRVCRSIVITGSRRTERHCQSKEDWDRAEEEAFRTLQDSQTSDSRRDGELAGQGQAVAPR